MLTCHTNNGVYLFFETSSDRTWEVLGVELPEPALHNYSARIHEGGLVVIAEGNLDDDSFLDLWYGYLGEDAPYAALVASDALNLDLYPDEHIE